MNRSEPFNIHPAVEPEQLVSIENSCPSRRLGPSDGQESPPRVPREEGSGDGSVLRIEASSLAELTTLLAEIKIRVCQMRDGGMELTICRDGRVMVPEHVSNREGGELLHVEGLGDQVQAELGRLGERMVLLDYQERGAAVPTRECSGGTEQSEGKDKWAARLRD